MNLEGKKFSPRNYDFSDDSRDSWLKLVEIFSECKITHATDKLMAIAGLVQYKSTHSRNTYHNWKNIVSLWESTLYKDLLWASRSKKLAFLSSLMLPSWTWAAYEGSVTFVKDRRSLREPETVRREPVSEVQLVAVELLEHP